MYNSKNESYDSKRIIMSNPLVSVVIPTYNREKTIKRCIDSVLNQTYKNIEIIVVDDGSTDDTKTIIDGYIAVGNGGGGDDIIHYLYQENAGAQVARNKGIRHSNAEWITFLDSDDEWMSDKLEKQVKIIQENHYNRYIVIHSDAILRDTINKTERLFGIPKVCGDNVYPLLLQHPSPMFGAILTSKLALQEIGYLDEDVPSYQEWDTAIRLSKICKFIQMQEPSFIYYYHLMETISKDKIRDIQGYDYVINKYRNEMSKFALKGTYENHLIIQYKKCINWKLRKIAFKFFLRMPFDYQLKILLRNMLKILFQKVKQGDKRKVTILKFIKFSYHKNKL